MQANSWPGGLTVLNAINSRDKAMGSIGMGGQLAPKVWDYIDRNAVAGDVRPKFDAMRLRFVSPCR
jgi:hypothetical protein